MTGLIVLSISALGCSFAPNFNAMLVVYSISGLGIREVTAVYLFDLVGIAPKITIGIYLIILFFNYITAFICLTSSKEKDLFLKSSYKISNS